MTDSAPFFSICIPTYNRAHLLPAALESALQQTDPDFEIVVVDNASTDDTQTILQRYTDPRIRVIRNAQTVSMFANHNICIEHARAPWVVFLHSDDRLIPSALSLFRLDLKNDNIDVICSPSGGWQVLNNTHPQMLTGKGGVAMILRRRAPTPSGCAYRKKRLSEIGFDPDLIAADYMILFDLINSGSTILMSPRTAVYIGSGQHQYSSAWMLNGGYTLDVSRVVGKILDVFQDFNYLVNDMNTWSADEIATFLMFAAHANKFKEIAAIETLLRPRYDYKSSRHYRHVLLGRILGAPFITALLLTIRRAKIIVQR